MSVKTIPIAHPGRPELNRRINHDDQSWYYRVNTRGLEIVDRTWTMHMADGLLNQGQIGSCTANASDEMLASDPLYGTLPPATQTDVTSGTQKWPLAFYALETQDDDVDGSYPAEDTGSDALGMGKAAVARGDASGYQHTFTAEDAIKTIANVGPMGWGTLWKSGMDDVDPDTGLIKYSGATRGGHELCLFRVDAKDELLWGHNHWGAWGYQNGGTFCISFSDFTKSLKDDGDSVIFTPVSAPAPVPVPDPAPIPGGAVTVLGTDLDTLDLGTQKWRGSRWPCTDSTPSKKVVEHFLSLYRPSAS